MLFAQTNTRKNDFIIYKSLLKNYQKSPAKYKKTREIFERTLVQARNLMNEQIEFFDVDSETYYLVKYLAKDCQEELHQLEENAGQLTLTTKNIKILDDCLTKKLPTT